MLKILQAIQSLGKRKWAAYLACASLSACAGRSVATSPFPHDIKDLLNGKPELHIEARGPNTRSFWYMEIMVEGHPRHFPLPMILFVCTYGGCQSQPVPVHYLRYYNLKMVPVRPPHPFVTQIPISVSIHNIKGIHPITGQPIPIQIPFLESKLLEKLHDKY